MTEAGGSGRAAAPPVQYAAIDFGASSGRVVCGRFDGRVMTLEPCHRFPNRPVRLPDGLRWNLLQLFAEAVGALRGRRLDGVGVDTWGVDYALLDEHGPTHHVALGVGHVADEVRNVARLLGLEFARVG